MLQCLKDSELGSVSLEMPNDDDEDDDYVAETREISSCLVADPSQAETQLPQMHSPLAVTSSGNTSGHSTDLDLMIMELEFFDSNQSEARHACVR